MSDHVTAQPGHGPCHGPDCREPAVRVGGFCSEACYWSWHRAQWLEGKTPAEYVLEWRHPYLGEIREACCRLHYDKVRGALRALGIGHAGAWADSEACVRCIHEGKETRDWIASAVTPEQVDIVTRLRAALSIGFVIAATLVGATCTASAASAVTITQLPTPLGVGAKHSAFPSMMLDNGQLTLVWRQGSDHYAKRDGNIMLSTSTDSGSTWTPAQTVRTGGDHRDPSISRANGSSWLTWFAGSTASPAIGAFSQRDQWGATVRVDALPYAATTSPIVQLPNGELAAAFYGRQTGETYDTCWMAWSKDGRAWTRNRITNMLGSKVHTNEPYLVVDGNLTHMFYRWGSADGIGMRTSTDSGHSGWGAPRKILSQASGRPTVLATSSGVLVMVYRKLPTKAAQIAYSSDHGATWLDGGLLMAPPVGSPNGMTYASMAETSPGEVLVVVGMESTASSSDLYSARLTVGQ